MTLKLAKDDLEGRKAYTRERKREWWGQNKQKAASFTQKWKVRNPDKVKACRKAWMSVPENRLKYLVSRAKERCKKSGKEFSITINDVLPAPTHCPVLGIELNYKGTGRKGGFRGNSPSIDRLDPNLGYVPGNVCVMSWRANNIKRDCTVEEVRLLLAFMQSHPGITVEGEAS